MKTAEELTHEHLISDDTVGYQRSHVIKCMKEYATQAISVYRSKILHMPSDERDNDFFILKLDTDDILI